MGLGFTSFVQAQSIFEVSLPKEINEQRAQKLLLVVIGDGTAFLKNNISSISGSNSSTNQINLKEFIPITGSKAKIDSLFYYEGISNTFATSQNRQGDFILCMQVKDDSTATPLGIINDSNALANIRNGKIAFSNSIQTFENTKAVVPSSETNSLIANYFSSSDPFLGIGFESQSISGSSYNKNNVVNTLARKITPGPQDIVVFYYSGHGYRLPKDTKRYPFIDLRAKPTDNYLTECLNIEAVFATIKRKNARLNLVISDCCNSLVETPNAAGTGLSGTKSLGTNFSFNNVKTLFLNPTPMSILATAADVDQKATSNNYYGGFFTNLLLRSLNSYGSIFQTLPNWQQVLTSARNQTSSLASKTYCAEPDIRENLCNQAPIFSIK